MPTIKHVLLIMILSFCLPALTIAQIHNFIGIPLLSSETVPPVESDAHGVINVLYDDETNTLIYSYNWQLSKGSEATMAHFHGPAKRGEVASPRTPSLAVDFLKIFGLNSGAGEEGEGIEGDLESSETETHNDLSSSSAKFCEVLTLFGKGCSEGEASGTSLNSGFVSGKLVISEHDEKELLAGLWYLNFHTTAHPTGEIRGQLKQNTPQSSVSYFDNEALELNLPLLLLGKQAYDLTLELEEKDGILLFGIKEFSEYGDEKPAY